MNTPAEYIVETISLTTQRRFVRTFDSYNQSLSYATRKNETHNIKHYRLANDCIMETYPSLYNHEYNLRTKFQIMKMAINAGYTQYVRQYDAEMAKWAISNEIMVESHFEPTAQMIELAFECILKYNNGTWSMKDIDEAIHNM